MTNLTVDCDSRVFSYRNRQIRLIRVLRIFIRNLKKYLLVRAYLLSKVMTLSFPVLSEGIFLLSHLYLQILWRDNKFSLIHKIYRLPFPSLCQLLSMTEGFIPVKSRACVIHLFVSKSSSYQKLKKV